MKKKEKKEEEKKRTLSRQSYTHICAFKTLKPYAYISDEFSIHFLYESFENDFTRRYKLFRSRRVTN